MPADKESLFTVGLRLLDSSLMRLIVGGLGCLLFLACKGPKGGTPSDGEPSSCDDVPLLCGDCAPVLIESLQSTSPPVCTWTTTAIDALDAEAAGFPIDDYLGAVVGTFETGVRFEHAAIEDTWTTRVSETGEYALVEGMGEEGTDPDACPSHVEVGLTIELSGTDCSIAGSLLGSASLQKGSAPEFWQVTLSDSAHALRGNVTVKPPALPEPQGLIATFHLTRFRNDSSEIRIGLDLDGFYSDPENGDVWADIFESVTPLDGCPTWAPPAPDDCTPLR